MFRSFSLLTALFLLTAAPLFAEVVEEKYGDGKTKIKYSTDADNRKDGAYAEFYPDGKPKVKATYKAGQLDGTYSTYYENGKVEKTDTYKAGKKSGAHTEYTEKGQHRLTITYRDDKLDGPLTQYEDGKAIFVQQFKNGEPVYGKNLDELKKKLVDIIGADGRKDGEAAERETALRCLKAFRYLCNVPYEDLTLDDEMNKKALAAAKLCEKIGHLDHKPANPGLPEDEYKLAYAGTSQSNLAWGDPDLVASVIAWMNDSDKSNIDRIGHRRWCLNPAMEKVGFGRSGKYGAMFAFDRSRKKVPDYDYISFPPAGLMPIEFITPEHAWNISFNPAKFRALDDNVKVTVQEADDLFQPVGDALKLNSVRNNNEGFGVPYCLIFRPEKFEKKPGKRYLVTVTGLTSRQKAPVTLRFPVEFVSYK